MSNPALRLADLLAGFTVPVNKFPENVRADFLGVPYEEAAEKELEFWRAQVEVVGLVSEVDRAVASLEKAGVPGIEPYKIKLVTWYQAAFAFTTPWETRSSTEHRPALAPDDLLILRALGSTLQLASMAVDGPQSDNVSLLDALADLLGLLDSADYLPIAMRSYVYSLVNEAMHSLQYYERFGSTPTRKITLVLAGVMEAIIDSGVVPKGDPENAWRAKLRDIVGTWVTAAGLAIGTFAGGVAQQAIAPGDSGKPSPEIVIVNELEQVPPAPPDAPRKATNSRPPHGSAPS